MSDVDPQAGLREGIEALTNAVFERVQPHIARYAQDERRISKNGSLTLAAHRTTMHNLERGYGRLTLKVCDKESHRQAVRQLTDSPWIRKIGSMTHADLLLEREDERFRPMAAALAILALRDEHPQGHTQDRFFDGDMWGSADYDPAVLGERYKIGVLLTVLFDDSSVPDRPTLWDFGVELQSRFDRPEPQTKMTSDINGYVGTRDVEHRVLKPTLETRLPARPEHLALMQEIVGTAKDIRPVVDPIAEHLSYQKEISEAWQRFKAGPSSTTANFSS